jgi:hypothetical protein
MAYIGQGIKQGTFKVLDTSGNTYNGSNVTFSLGTQVGSAAQLLVSHDGVIQLPGTDYTLATGGTQITFSTAPASGASIFIVEISGAVGGTVTPSDNSVGITQLNVSDGSSGQALTTNGSGTLSFASVGLAGIDDQSSSNDDQLTITDTAVVVNEDSDDVDFRVESNGNANMLFLDGGNNRVLLGSATSVAPMSLEGALQVTGNSVNAVSLNRFTADDGGFDLIFLSSRNATPGSNTIVQDNDELGALHFCADDGTDYASKGAKISAKVNGTPGANDIPTELIFATTADGSPSPTDRIAIKANGKVVIAAENMANDIAAGNFGISLFNTNSGSLFFGGGTGTETQMNFGNDNGVVGSIQTSGSGTSFNTSSDYRLKENIDYTWDATTRLKQLKPARFNFIADDTNTLLDGFLAHEVSSIVPEAVSGEKDATETKTKVVVSSKGGILAEGVEQSDWTQGKESGKYPSNSTWEASNTSIIAQGIDQAKLVPLLVKTIQELEARIKALEDA